MIEFTLITTAEYAEHISMRLTLLGAVAVTWQDAGDQAIYEPLPDQMLRWDSIKLAAMFADAGLADAISRYLASIQTDGQLLSFDVREVTQENWVEINQKLSAPQLFGTRLWICPSWCTPPDPQAVNVAFNPGLAFGTGSHPTTALCLEWLDEQIHGQATMIDYGCGSGILAIAALKLGVQQVIAVDHDEQALDACRMNAALNHLSNERLTVCLPATLEISPADILIANILAQPLQILAPQFATLVQPQGQLVLSGVLTDQVDALVRVYEPWFAIHQVVHRSGWARIEASKLKII